jgi:membrane protein implicated in regulation of membrane protease activity
MAPWGMSRLTARPALTVALRYGLAVASVATALGTTLILRHYGFPPRFISHFTLIAIAITFWCAGTGPGLLALLLSCLGVSVLARTHLLLPGFPLESFFVFYVIFSLLMSWFSASRRRAQQLVTASRDNLELRVAERTGELVRANASLEDTQAALRSREAYLAQAQRLSQTGSFGWRPSIGEIL